MVLDTRIYNKQKARPHNRRLAKKRVQCLNEALCFVSSSVLADSLVLRNPLLRQAPKRYWLVCRNYAEENNLKKNFGSTKFKREA